MSFTPVSLLKVLLSHQGKILPVGRLALKSQRIFFEYDGSFLERGLALSPFKLPLRAGLHSTTDGVFDGLFGLFNDSLPDGWGRLLLDRKMRQSGIAPEKLTALDRLAHVGHQGMGALIYEPDYGEAISSETILDLDRLARESSAILEGAVSDVLGELLSLNCSSAGARPKVMVAVSEDKKTIYHGIGQIPPGTEAWLIKFSASQDSKDSGPVEYAYSLMARAAGLTMPETCLFQVSHRKKQTGKYFGVKRFDRKSEERLHIHTACGLLHADHRLPSLDYESLLRATMHLTKSMPEVEQIFRLAVFNVLTHNRDDHAKNFSFQMEADRSWRAAPAYDLTFSSGPAGEHSTAVLGEGKNPDQSHLLALGKTMDISQRKQIIEEVKAIIARWYDFADEAEVSQSTSRAIGHVLVP